jgi:hypothetical protein
MSRIRSLVPIMRTLLVATLFVVACADADPQGSGPAQPADEEPTGAAGAGGSPRSMGSAGARGGAPGPVDAGEGGRGGAAPPGPGPVSDPDAAAAVDTGSPTGDAAPADTGGTPRDAGGGPTTTDAGGPIGAGGASRCSGTDLKFCDGFEEGSLRDRGWNPSGPVVDEVRPYRGRRSLHIKAASANRPYWIRRNVAEIATQGNNVLYSRMFVWFEDPLTSGGHFGLSEGLGKESTNARFGGQFNAFGVGNHGGPTGDWTDNDGIRIKDKIWYCVEVMFDGPNNRFRVWVDDVERPRLASGANRHPGYRMPKFETMWFGWFLYYLLEPQELFIDEIAIDTTRIGCAK